MYQLTIKQPSNLLSVVLSQEITPAQVSIVTAIVKDSTITYGEVLAFLAMRRIKALDQPGVLRDFADAPAGAGDEVEAYRG